MNFKRLLPLIIVAPAFFMACGDSSNEPKPVSEEKTVVGKVGVGEKTAIDAQTVPAPVKTTFDNNYTKAENVKWSSYKPVAANGQELLLCYLQVELHSL